MESQNLTPEQRQMKTSFLRLMHAHGRHRWTLRFGPLMLLDQDSGSLYPLKTGATLDDALDEMMRIETTHTVDDLRNSWEAYCGSCRVEQRFMESHAGDLIACQACGHEKVL